MAQEFPLRLVIGVLTKGTEKLRALNEKIQSATAPARQLNNSVFELGKSSGLFRLSAAFQGVGKAAGGVLREVKGVGMALAGAAVTGYGLLRAITGIADSGDNLRNLSVRTKVSVKELAEFQYVAKQADITTDEFAGAMDTLNKNLGQAKAGTGKLSALLNLVNPQFLAQLKNVKGNGAALDMLFQALTKLKDPNKRAALAVAAFGNEAGKKMANLLENGTKGVEELREEFRALAGDQTAFAEQSSKFDAAWKQLTTSFEGARNAVMVELFPALTELMGVLKQLVLDNKDAIVQWAREFAKNLPQHLDTITTAFKVLAAVLALKVVVAFGGLIQAVYALGVAIATTPLGWILLALVGIAAAAYLVYKNWDAITEVLRPLTDALKGLWGVLDPLLMPVLKLLGGSVMMAIRAQFQAVGLVIEGVVFGLTKVVEGATKAIQFVKELFTASDDLALGGANMVVPPGMETSLAMGGAMVPAQAKVTVDFANMPKGTRVSSDPSGTADLDLGMGYNMTEAY